MIKPKHFDREPGDPGKWTYAKHTSSLLIWTAWILSLTVKAYSRPAFYLSLQCWKSL
jgi:hypothetical protein